MTTLDNELRTDPHADAHSEQGALHGEHPGRAKNPVVKVRDLAWLELEKPDLDVAECFGHDFGFATALRTPDVLHLRGTRPNAPCLVIRKGPRDRFIGSAFLAAEAADLDRLARATERSVEPLTDGLEGRVVDLVDPAGQRVRVVHGMTALRELPPQEALVWNRPGALHRVNATQRPPRAPASVERLGHVVLERLNIRANLDWYLEHLGLIVSDFLYFGGQRERGPVMGFIRCDLGSEPTDHHTLAMVIAPRDGYVHSAYEVADLDALAAGGRYLQTKGYTHSWGIGRHVQGSQVFDYWRAPGGLMFEHFTDGDRFDSSLEPGWAQMAVSGLSQWGPPVSKDFLGMKPGPETVSALRDVITSLRADNEFDLRRFTGLLRSAKQ